VLERYLTDGWIPQTHRNVGLELQAAVLLLLGDDQHGGEEEHQALLVVLLHQQSLLTQFTQDSEL